jgi:hypothetical protein
MKEEKEVLLKVLCAMLPYGVKCHFKYGSAEGDVILKCIDGNIARFDYAWYGRFHVSIDADYIKPYLRPLSSMTKEEKQESRWYQRDAKSDNFILYMNRYEEWLDSKHFDWRTDGNGKTMIELGLALEATEGMYNN